MISKFLINALTRMISMQGNETSLPLELCSTCKLISLTFCDDDDDDDDDSLIHSFIHCGHFYSAPSSPLPLRGAPDYSTDTVSEFHAEAHRQLQVKDLPKVPT